MRRGAALPEARLTFILGGARSGKSGYAEKLISTLPPPWTYIATAEAYDDEMRERIALHRQRRDERWVNHDSPIDLVGTLQGIGDRAPVLVDCLTLWLSNHLLADHDVGHACKTLEAVLRRRRGATFVVSNEVGLGIVPDNALARRFRDLQGRLNQQVAAIADEVIFMVAGLPMRVK